ncbi:short chain dehydrogenase/NAD(P)-binding protein [Acrasis kona]|uniref:Short chain dehydrogenase/NAD(P)-binding protein n=1 Tax=Acrasis kona TaxID=1008807 RepID=A0AAW2YU98_9EUKA
MFKIFLIATTLTLSIFIGNHYFYSQKMQAARSFNKSIKALKPVSVFVGATSGIGQHTALKISEHTSSDKIIITGRNKAAGDLIVHDLNTLSTNNGVNPKHEFISCDVTSMKNVRKYTDDLKSRLQKINILFLTPGFLSFEGRDESEEGIDKKLACNYYARYLLIRELMPLLENAIKEGEQARVISVLGAGYEGNFFVNDLDLKHNFGIVNAANAATTYNSLMVQKFSEEHPEISFSHVNPGGVNTGATKGLPWYLQFINYVPKQILNTFLTKPEDIAEIMTFIATNPNYAKGWHLINSRGEELERSKYQTRENVDLVWDHTNNLINKALL